VPLGAFDDLLWHKAGVLPDDYLSYRVLPDAQADEVERERQSLRRLQGVLDWRPYYGDQKAGVPSMPMKMTETLKTSMAGTLISTWVQLRTAEVVLDEMALEFGGADPLRPFIRAEVEETKHDLLEIQEHLRFFNMEVVLREPLEEELAEMRGWVRERAG
jgi:hypothetical protein